MDVIGAGLDLIRQDEVRAILTDFPRLGFKRQFQDRLRSIVRRKPTTTYDNVLRDLPALDKRLFQDCGSGLVRFSPPGESCWVK